MADFDQWQQNPYTKTLQDSITRDYVPRSDLREAHDLLGKVYALMQRGEITHTPRQYGGIWCLPDQIGAWLEGQDARNAGVDVPGNDQGENHG